MSWTGLVLLGIFFSTHALLASEIIDCSTAGTCRFSKNSLEGEIQKIEGKFKFYPEQLFESQEKAQGIPLFLPLNLFWNRVDLPKVSPLGFGTYQMTMVFEDSQALTLRLPKLISASKVFINGQLVSEKGRLAQSASSEVPGNGLHAFEFKPRLGENDLIVQVSNYSHYFGGGAGAMQIGTPQSMAADASISLMRDTFIFGALFVMMIYHLYLWSLRPQFRAPLYFSLLCLANGLRSLEIGRGEALIKLFPKISFETMAVIEYLGFSAAVGFFALLVHLLYPKEFLKGPAQVVAGLAGLWTFIIATSSSKVFPIFLPYFQIVTAATALYGIYAMLLAVKRRREASILFLFGFCSLTFTAIYDVLASQNILPNLQLVQFGSFGFIIVQALILCYTFQKAFVRAESAEHQVRLLNQSLEKMVEERTKTIHTILDNVRSGFLLLGASGKLLAGFSKSCGEILHRELQVEKIFIKQLDLSQRERMTFSMALDQVFQGGLPSDVSLEQIPKRIKHCGRDIGIQAAGIMNSETKALESVLLTINDVTALNEAEKKLKENEAILAIMSNLDAYMLFLRDIRKSMVQIPKDITNKDEGRIKMFLHTLKGNLRSFGLDEIANQVHQIEGHETLGTEEIDAIIKQVLNYTKEHEEVFAIDVDKLQAKAYFIYGIELKELMNSLESSNSQSRERLKHFMSTLELPTIRSLTGPLDRIARQTAEQLNKRVDIAIEGDYQRVDERYGLLLKNLVHLVNNAVDHGIERERGTKSPQGHVCINFASDPNGLLISLSDDGRGLDKERILAKAKAMHIVDSTVDLSDEAVTQFIFHPDFSTAENVTDISGRGMGLSSLKSAVETLNGTISVESGRDVGTKFVIRIPASSIDQSHRNAV